MYVVNPDGSGETQLAAQGISPAWSPAGDKLAFRCELLGVGGGICTSDASGGSVMTLGEGLESGAMADAPTWSPDGAHIAYEAGFFDVPFSPPPNIEEMSSDGSGKTTLTEPGQVPDWSPDGTRIAFAWDGINVMNAEGSGRAQITTGESDSHPSWSPDGSRIAFGRNGDIYTIRPDGSDLTHVARVANTPAIESDPVWSPDGRKIAFGGSDGSINGVFGIYVMNADGTDPALVARNGMGPPAWQSIRGPQRSDYKNAAQFCKAERDFFGNAAFTKKYGGGANAYGKCVSGK